jgi:hypothetical protein
MIQRDLPKHNKYQTSYKRFDTYWGFGIEHETYIKTSQTKTFTTFEENMKPERYSVSYYTNYKDEKKLKDTLQKLIDEQKDKKVVVPILLNSHSFTHTDKYGIHKTTFEKLPKVNKQFEGETFFEWCCKHSSWLKENYEKGFMWDGDSIEFINQKFYKVTLQSVLNELKDVEKRFVDELAKLPKQGLLIAYNPLLLTSPSNPPFATYYTNPKNISMFNNGTFHINITLPTRLGFWNPKEPSNWPIFEEKHRRFARCIQWIEPLWIAVYGAGDPLANYSDEFAKGSQRVAVSRYIGLGTFDTDTMPRGKILQLKRKDCPPMPWYSSLYKKTSYTELDDIGLDINFNKHGAHGLELRFLDQMSFEDLEKVCKDIILVGDFSLTQKNIINPRNSPLWQKAAEEALLNGKEWILEPAFMNLVCLVFQVKECFKESMGVNDFLIFLMSKLPKNGICWQKMVNEKKKKSCCICFSE